MYTTNLDYTKKILSHLLNIPSPSGYCHEIMKELEKEVKALGYGFDYTQKGNGLVTVSEEEREEREEREGRDVRDGKKRQGLLLSAHVDTLGAMVRSIKEDGKLRMTSVGGFMMQSVEGEYCKVHTRDNKVITGTILSTMPSVHVYSEARSLERKEDVMEIRLDADVKTKEDVLALGITVGDYISFDPRVVFTEDGFIKSRHLDDKAGIAAIMGALDYIHENKLKPKKVLKVMFSTYEEVGHGSSYIPEGIDTLLAVDMGAIGDDLTCTEKDVSICVKDSSGPYDYQMIGKLIDMAKDLGLDYALDVYPSYASDASAALRGGYNIKAALIGPGIHASHTMERTHENSLLGTVNLLIAFMLDE
jgi:putative aminopeptidase FrvX